VLGRAASELMDRVASAPNWAARFRLLDRVLADWIAQGPEADREVRWAWDQLAASGGLVPIGDLAQEVGWSRRHLTSRFRSQVGLAPKPAGRVLRFERACGLLLGDGAGSISDVAASTGYADHSHLVREFRDLAGCTPTELGAAAEADLFGLAG
jgi:AraC-like DNA-binding protein